MNKNYVKYNIRPAGDSDDCDSDSDGFSFPEDRRPKGNRNNYDNDNDQPNVEDPSIREQQAALEAKRNLEYEAIKACYSGNREVISDYVNSGNDVNEVLHTEWTLLLYAASSIQPEIIKQLLELGADANKDKAGFTPLMALCQSIKVTSEDKALPCLHLLLEHYANPNATNANRENAFMLGIKLRSDKFLEELMNLTNDLNLTDSEGNTALHYAALYNRLVIVKLLLKKNVDTGITNRHGATAYDCAVTKQFADIQEALASTGDDDPVCDVLTISKWQDLFPDLTGLHENKVLHDISVILYGMGLEKYVSLFKGMPLKTFLCLTEEDLEKLGMDLSIHRTRFIEELYKFHSHKWNSRSMGSQKSKNSFKMFDCVLSLGNCIRKFNVIGSSFNYIRRSIMDSKTNSLLLTPEQKQEYEMELQKTEDTMIKLKKELWEINNFAKKIEAENCNSYPATYISKKKVDWNWGPVIMAIVAVLGLGVYKGYQTHRLLPID